MGNPEVDSLKAAFSVASIRSEWSTIVVVVGVFIEFVALFVFSKHMPRSEKAVMVFATALVALGCGGEYIFGSRATDAATQLQNASDIEVAEAHKSANEAAKKAGELGISLDTLSQTVDKQKKLIKDAVDDLNRETTALNKARDDAQISANKSKESMEKMTALLEQERVLRDKLDAKTRPREISDAQMAEVAKVISKFPGQKFDVATVMDMKEPGDLTQRLFTVLINGKWIYDKPVNQGFLLGGVEGVLIYAHPESSENTKAAAVALAKALNAIGIASALRFQNDPGHPNDKINISIGTKPQLGS